MQKAKRSSCGLATAKESSLGIPLLHLTQQLKMTPDGVTIRQTRGHSGPRQGCCLPSGSRPASLKRAEIVGVTLPEFCVSGPPETDPDLRLGREPIGFAGKGYYVSVDRFREAICA